MSAGSTTDGTTGSTDGATFEIISTVTASPGEDTLILEQVMIKNIDTGETLPLSKADDVVTPCFNPLDLHLIKITNPYPDSESDVSDLNSCGSVEDLDGVYGEGSSHPSSSSSKRGKELGLKAVKNIKKVGKFGKDVFKGVKNGVEKHRLAKAEASTSEQPVMTSSQHDSSQVFRIKVNKKKQSDFGSLKLVQDLQDCKGAIWCMKWSVDGQLIAVAGQDQLLRVYCCSKAWKYFTQLRSKASGQQTSPCSTKDRSNSGSQSNSLSSQSDSVSEGGGSGAAGGVTSPFNTSASNSRVWSEDNTLSEEGPLLLFSAYRGHTADVLDVSWSKNHFLLSSSMDKTVRLWHVTRVECLCTLRHSDFVTTIQFHPRDDRYFMSGSLDGKLRLWNIPEKRVSLWNEVAALPSQTSSLTPSLVKRKDSKGGVKEDQPSHGLITASAFVQNGKFAVIGTYDGRIIFFTTDQLKYFTQLHISAKGILASAAPDLSAVGAAKGRGRKKCNKVTGIEGVDDNKILVTTNDSRIRLYDLRDLSLVCKYKGLVNGSSQIRASVSHDNKFIACGSENSSFYLWKLQESTAIGQRRDKNDLWEQVRILSSAPTAPEGILGQSTGTTASGTTPGPGLGPSSGIVPPTASKSHAPPSIITSATFAPTPKLLDEEATYVLAVADFNGTIRVFSK